jgi:glycine/D-amino acid oxidase-like deaminating enzyme
MRVLIVGGGIMGLCSAWALGRAGHEIALYEQGPIPNPLGSSVDQHRLIRFAYGAMTGYATMVRDAYAAWERLWSDLGVRHYQETGTLVVSRTASEGWVGQSRDCLQAMNLPVERWGPAQLAERLPFLDVTDVAWALFTPTGGVLFAERIVADLARHLAARGVAVHAGAKVREVDPARAAVHLEDGRCISGDVLIVAAGPWAPRLLPSLSGRVVPSRQVAVYLEPPAEHAALWRTAPSLLDQFEAAKGGFYAIPPVGGADLKMGDHGFSMQGDPHRKRDATAGDVEAALATARARIAGFERYRVGRAKTCFYSVAEGERFIAEPLERAWVLAGFSGHGFKFGALIGEAIADTLDGRRTSQAMTTFAAGAE